MMIAGIFPDFAQLRTVFRLTFKDLATISGPTNSSVLLRLLVCMHRFSDSVLFIFWASMNPRGVSLMKLLLRGNFLIGVLLGELERWQRGPIWADAPDLLGIALGNDAHVVLTQGRESSRVPMFEDEALDWIS